MEVSPLRKHGFGQLADDPQIGQSRFLCNFPNQSRRNVLVRLDSARGNLPARLGVGALDKCQQLHATTANAGDVGDDLLGHHHPS